MWIVKLGGSLQDFVDLPALIQTLTNSRHALIIVPGGGTFADTVRRSQKRWRFSDEIAHHMALLAMDQNALLLSALDSRLKPFVNLQRMEKLLAVRKVPVWQPSQMVLAATGIQQDWTMTSDSLSAWLAKKLSVKGLLLVKSCHVSSAQVTATKLSREGIVDQAFPTMVAESNYQIRVIQRENYSQLNHLLAGHEVEALQVSAE